MAPRRALTVRRIESMAANADDGTALVKLRRSKQAEITPTDPQLSGRECEAGFFAAPADQQVVVYLASLGSTPAGFATGRTVSKPGDSLQVAVVDVFVDPPSRQRDVAAALAETLIAALVELGQSSMLAEACTTVTPQASAALCARYGLTPRSAERRSRLVMADLDGPTMQAWIDNSSRSTPGYRLEQWEGRCPDHLAEHWAKAKTAMEDEPLDDLDYNPHTRSPEEQHQADAVRSGLGYRIYRTLCLGPNNEAAGLTALHVHEDRPQFGLQADTGVRREHRGRRIGRWLKAANLDQVRKNHPELAVVETSNAEQNPWMLNINVAMGFEPHLGYQLYQGPTAPTPDA